MMHCTTKIAVSLSSTLLNASFENQKQQKKSMILSPKKNHEKSQERSRSSTKEHIPHIHHLLRRKKEGKKEVGRQHDAIVEDHVVEAGHQKQSNVPQQRHCRPLRGKDSSEAFNWKCDGPWWGTKHHRVTVQCLTRRNLCEPGLSKSKINKWNSDRFPQSKTSSLGGCPVICYKQKLNDLVVLKHVPNQKTKCWRNSSKVPHNKNAEQLTNIHKLENKLTSGSETKRPNSVASDPACWEWERDVQSSSSWRPKDVKRFKICSNQVDRCW